MVSWFSRLFDLIWIFARIFRIKRCFQTYLSWMFIHSIKENPFQILDLKRTKNNLKVLIITYKNQKIFHIFVPSSRYSNPKIPDNIWKKLLCKNCFALRGCYQSHNPSSSPLPNKTFCFFFIVSFSNVFQVY